MNLCSNKESTLLTSSRQLVWIANSGKLFKLPSSNSVPVFTEEAAKSTIQVHFSWGHLDLLNINSLKDHPFLSHTSQSNRFFSRHPRDSKYILYQQLTVYEIDSDFQWCKVAYDMLHTEVRSYLFFTSYIMISLHHESERLSVSSFPWTYFHHRPW